MKPGILLLVTVLLVAGGIFVYDTLTVRSQEGAPETLERSETTADSEPAPEARTEAEADDAPRGFPVLEGVGDDIWRDEIERRLAALEVRDPSAEPATDPETGLAIPGVDEDGEGEDQTEPVDEETRRQQQREKLQRFRRMLEAVERQRKWEQQARKVKQYLDTLDLALTDEQKGRVVRTTVHFQNRWWQESRKPANTDEEKQVRREAYQGLWNEYSAALHEQIPSAEVQVILDSLQNAGRKDGKR